MIKSSVYYNGDDCFLSWKMPTTPGCWGVAIYRKIERPGKPVFEGFLENRTGFDGDNNPPNSHKSSELWPFQRYTWTDHGVDEGDTVTYTIYPVMQTATGLKTDKTNGSVAGPITATAAGSGKVSAYFNRGFVLSQFMAKAMRDKYGNDWNSDANIKGNLMKFKNSLKKDDSDLRKFLMGQLGDKLLHLLAMAKTKGWHIYAALYELDDDALVAALLTLGKKAHIVLSNGSNKKKGEDGNKKAVATLGKKIDMTRRMLWSEGLGHNKFLVIAKSPTEPMMVWTGSTNWATTGLCTQLNNGILVEDKKVADVYKKQWLLLKNDKRTGKTGRTDMHFGDALMKSNDVVKTGTAGATGKWNVQFTRTSGAQDMDLLSGLINGANDAILFLMFEPGNSGLLQVIQSRLSPASEHFNDKLYIHGVANSLKPGGFGNTLNVNLVSRGQSKPFDLKAVQPEGVKNLAGWADEVGRDDFIMQKDPRTGKTGVIGHAIIHSKIIVIDPFTNPVIITGSHNFSVSASSKNDENVIVIKDNKELAERYCVNIMAAYQHYRWRSYLLQCQLDGVSPWQGLKKDDQWQSKNIDKNEELNFWVNP
jgi:PLD-like domain